VLTISKLPLRFAAVATLAVASSFGVAAHATDHTGPGSTFV
jgi:phosphate transport system substrate-binding protein